MSFEILNRWTGAKIFASETAETISEAIAQAMAVVANLREANLSGANLSGANLSGANLSGADLRRADLREANLSEANLSGADLRRADLRRADLREANLSGANLSGADLRRADLRRADLRRADLREASCNTAFGGDFLVLRGSRHSLIATSDAISIGCMRNTLDWWREHYAAVGRSEKYSTAEVEEYRQHIEYAAAWFAARKPAEVAA